MLEWHNGSAVGFCVGGSPFESRLNVHGCTYVHYADRCRGNTLLRHGTFFLNLFHFVFHQPFFHSRRFFRATNGVVK